MRYLSVCSGIEAATVAWHPLGWQPAAFSEVDAFPSAVLAHHYPHVLNLGDMTKFEEWPNADVDVLVGGSPCQSFSIAGLRKGLDDPRGNLMLTFGAVAGRYRPTWVVWENVPGVLSSNGGRDFGAFLRMLGELGYGYAYRVLDAQFFGVAQRRRRVFVVGHLGDWRRAAAVLFERHSLSGHPAPVREAGEGFAAGTLRSTDGGSDVDHARSRQLIETLCVATGQAGAEIGADMAPTLNCNHEAPYVAHTLRGEGFDASEDGTGRGTPLIPVAFAENSRAEVRLENGDGSIAGALSNGGGKAGQGVPCIAFDSRQDPVSSEHRFGALGSSSPQAQAIAYTTKLHNTTSNNAGKLFEERATCLDAKSPPPALLTAMQVRRLTPRECERLQGFQWQCEPDHPGAWQDDAGTWWSPDYTLIPHGRAIRIEKLEADWIKYLMRGGAMTFEQVCRAAADGPRYKALGNSMAVPVMSWIGRRIVSVSEIRRAA